MRTRTEHLQWCKDRANEYLEKGDVRNGITSFMSDMNKHDETKGAMSLMVPIAMSTMLSGNKEEAINFVDGFN